MAGHCFVQSLRPWDAAGSCIVVSPLAGTPAGMLHVNAEVVMNSASVLQAKTSHKPASRLFG